MSDLSGSESDGNNLPKRKKGVLNTENYKSNVIKRAKVKGIEHLNHVGKVISARITGPDCRCQMKCFSNFSEDQRKNIIDRVNSFDDKDAQDTFLQGLIESCSIKRKSKVSVTEKPKPKALTFSYHICLEGQRIKVCKQAFVSLHGITMKKVRRLSLLSASGTTPKDRRGKEVGSRHNAVSGEICTKIREFIEKFDVKEVHYSNTITKKYLPATLNVKVRHKMFIDKNLDLKGKVKYDFFLKFFHENFNLRFGRPQVDVCSYCEEYGQKLRDPNLNDNAKRIAAASLVVHKQRANKFFSKKNEIKELCAEKDNVMGLVFDYMQNLPLPNISVQEIFYLRQLWVYEFCIHNLKTGKATFYSYHEGQALKGPNEVCTFLNMYITWYINEYVDKSIDELYIFSDGCPGQNKNHTVVRFLMTLAATNRFKKITHYFPLRGHSFNDCDRDFGTVKRKIRRVDRIYSHQEYMELIKKASVSGKFDVKEIQNSQIIDYKKWWPTHYKKTTESIETQKGKVPRDQKVHFQISHYNHFRYDSANPGVLIVSEYIDGLTSFSFQLAKPAGSRTNLPAEEAYKAYTDKVPINKKKVDNLKSLIQYIPEENKEFYIMVFAWPTGVAEENPEEDF